MEFILFILGIAGIFAFWLFIALLWTWISRPKGDGTDVLVRVDKTFYEPMVTRKKVNGN